MARTKQTECNRKRRAKENGAASPNRREINVKVKKEKSKRAAPMKVTSGIAVGSDAMDGGRNVGNASEVELGSKVKDKLKAVVASFGDDGAKLSDFLKTYKGFIYCCKDRSGKQCSPLEVIRETMSDDIEVREIDRKNRLYVRNAHENLAVADVSHQVKVEVKTEQTKNKRVPLKPCLKNSTGNNKDASISDKEASSNPEKGSENLGISTEVNLVVSSRDLQVLRERMPDYEIREIDGKNTLCIKEAFLQNGTIRAQGEEGAATKRARSETSSASAPLYPLAKEEALRTKSSSDLFTTDRQGQSLCSPTGAAAANQQTAAPVRYS